MSQRERHGQPSASPGIEGRIVAVCVSERKGTSKTPVPEATLLAGHGLEGDAHAGGWHRQVSLLAVSSIDKMRAKGLDLACGDFAENLTVEGIDLPGLPVGTRFVVTSPGVAGGPLLEVTQIGKQCHQGCAIFQQVGDCVMPREGIFARVMKGGTVRPGDLISEFDPDIYLVGILTASDKGSRGERSDVSGKVATQMVEDAGGLVVSYEVVPDEKDLIKQRLLRLCDEVGLDLVLTSGGTGLGPRDVTPDATLDIIEKQVPGIAEAMRIESLKKTPRAMLSRAVAGTRGSTLVINLPGSPRAVEECLQAILPALGHGIQILRAHAAECARP
jgi:molybdenum cofactor synthesis domain-containing protein